MKMSEFLAEQWDGYRKDMKEMFDQFDRCLNLAKEMEAGAQNPRSAWFTLEVKQALFELRDLAAFRWTTPLGHLGGREPGEIAKGLQSWANAQCARSDENWKRMKGVTS